MANYRLSLEIELDASSPLEAAKKLEEWIRQEGEFQYYVQDEADKIYNVDLSKLDEDAVLPLESYYPVIKS